MKKYILLSIFLFSGWFANAQTENDVTINRRDTLLTRQEMLKRARKDYGPWMISVGGGYARWIAILPDSIDKEMRKYFNSLLWGYTVKGSAVYFLKSGIGFGLQYHAFHSSAKLDSTNYTSLKGSRIKERISMQFLTTGIQYRLIRRNGAGYYNFGVGFGYFVYNDFAKWETSAKVIDKIEVKGKFAGLQLQASYNYRIDPHVSLGIGMGINNGVLMDVRVNEATRSYTDTTMRGSLIHFDINAKLTIIL